PRRRATMPAARSENTGRAYGADWRAYAAWCRKRGLFEPSPEPQLIGLYITALASERQPGGQGPLNVRSIERRLAGLSWHFRQRGTPLDRQDAHIREVLRACTPNVGGTVVFVLCSPQRQRVNLSRDWSCGVLWTVPEAAA